jgi:hypothetical protein
MTRLTARELGDVLGFKPAAILDGARAAVEWPHLDPWTGKAPVPVLVVQSHSLRGALRDLARECRINVARLAGQSSISASTEAAESLTQWAQPLVVTDFGKSGADIERPRRSASEPSVATLSNWFRTGSRSPSSRSPSTTCP